MTQVTVIRVLLTIALLVVVWFHTHWSIALCLTLGALAIELIIWDRIANRDAGKRDTR